MLSKFEFTPNSDAKSTAVVAWDIGDNSVNQMPITNLQFEYTRSSIRRPKMEHVGSWPGFNKIDEILVHVDFDIIGSTTADFNARKRTLQNSFSPANNLAALIVEKIGDLKLNFDGDTEDMTGPVTLDGDISIPYTGPMLASCQMTLVIYQGYMNGVVTPANVYYPR